MRQQISLASTWDGDMSASWRARWFDGHRSTAQAVRVTLEGQLLRVHPDDDAASAAQAPTDIPLAGLSVGERFQTAPRMIGLPDGSSLQVEDDGGFDRALRQAGHRPGPAYRLIERWRHVLACGLLLIGVMVWVDRQGAGLLASFAVQFIPSSVDERLGRSALELADRQWLTPSSLPDTRRRAIEARFSSLVHEHYPQVACKLWFRGTHSAGWDDFNAFAVPGGTIVLLDGLAKAMDDEEVLAVLGHELGHVVHRDGMHGIAQQMGLLAVAGVVWGDMSSLAATVAAGFEGLRYSRAMEADADAFAVTFLSRGGIPVQHLADAFAVIEREEAKRGAMPTFLNDHPSTPERVRAARAAVHEQVPGSPAAGSH
jgi:Zn-dependent protease with chaperone function